MIDLNAPILPWEGLGGIKLYSHISKFYTLLNQEKVTTSLLGKYLVKYEISDKLDLWFNIVNGKLFKITTLKSYTGKLSNGIKLGMHIDKVLKIDSSFEYDDFEEVYCSPKGIFIETDPVTHTVIWISVYIKELEENNFIEGNW